MIAAILSDNQRKAELSHAFVAALAAAALGAGSRTVVMPRRNRIGDSGLAPLFAHVREATP